MIDNIYPESVEESGQYLRLALKSISENNHPYNPIVYSLWYDYATGRNEQLLKEVELIQSEDQGVSFDQVSGLFKKHVADSQLLLAEKKTKEFQRIIMEMVSQMTESGDSIDSQGSVLTSLATELSRSNTMETVGEIAKRIISETKNLVDSSKILSGQINSKLAEIEALRKEIEGIKEKAKTDVLTGLLNRRGFQDAMDQAIRETSQSNLPLSVIMVDIDHFKQVNDTYGHLIGDNVLKMLSKVIKANIKGRDIAARWGGDEFILGLPDTPADGAFHLGEQFRSNLLKMELKVKGTGQPIGKICISVGIAMYKAGDSLEQVIKKADDALYHSKKTGRDKTHISTV